LGNEDQEESVMSATLDLPAVRRFTDDLNHRLRRCDTGEGLECATLEQSIEYHARLCTELRSYVKQWARAVFIGEVSFDSSVERLLTEELRRLLQRAEQVAARGRAMDGECYQLQGLNELHSHIADFHFLLENWVSPRLAVSPAPRVKLSKAAASQIAERLRTLTD
jgi:hypothetical protein